MKLARVLFLLLCLHAGVSQAQTYVRPSDGTVLTLFTDVPLTTTPGVTSQIFNMSGFTGATFYLSTDQANCAKVAKVTVTEGSSSAALAAAATIPAQAVNAVFTSRSSLTPVSPEVWTVAPVQGFIRVSMIGSTNPEITPPANNCLATLKMVPIAFSGTPISRAGFSSHTFATTTASRIGSFGSVWGSIRYQRVQNLSGTPVYCGFDPRLVAPPGLPAVYGWILKPDTGVGTPAGDGGVVEFQDMSVPIYCVVTAGAAVLTVSEY